MKTLGHNIKRYRERSKFTQAELAKLLGIHKNHVSALERGRNIPGAELVEKLCDAFGIDEATLRFGGRLEDLGPAEQMLAQEIADLSPDERLEVILLLRKWKRDKRENP